MGGVTIIEPTSGNTGIALAFVASAAPAMAEGAKQPNQSVAPSSKGGHGHGGCCGCGHGGGYGGHGGGCGGLGLLGGGKGGLDLNSLGLLAAAGTAFYVLYSAITGMMSRRRRRSIREGEETNLHVQILRDVVSQGI